jgi:tripartite-type tricarboxylate transporter receptor subunit TctC
MRSESRDLRDRPAGSRRWRVAASVIAVAMVLTACDLGGGEYPGDQEVTLVVPFDAGGPTDTVTRLIADPMAEELGGTIVVSNVSGAGGTVAAGQVADAEPDGYTVLMHHIGMSTAPTLYPDLAYNPLEDFEMIGLVTEVPMTIVGSPNFEPNTLEELVTYVEENLDTVTYAHAGTGAASQLCGLLIEQATDLDLTEVPYDGTEPAMDDLLGDQVDFMCDQTTNTTEHILAGDIKAYAVTTAEPLETLPDVPTTEEAGLPDVQVTVWHGLYVPADTPQEIVDSLNSALKAAIQDEDVVNQLTDFGAPPVPQDRATPDAHRQLLEAQIEEWRPIIEEAGVTAS